MMTTNTQISHISKSNDSIHIKSAIECGEQISCQLSDSFSNGISDGDVLLISDNGNLYAHQVSNVSQNLIDLNYFIFKFLMLVNCKMYEFTSNVIVSEHTIMQPFAKKSV